MTSNYYTLSTNTILHLDNCDENVFIAHNLDPFEQQEENIFTGQTLDPVPLLYSYLFNDEFSVKERNSYLLTYFQDHISQNNVKVLRSTLSETNTLYELHVSFLKAMLMMTEHVQSVQDLRVRISEVYNERMGNH